MKRKSLNATKKTLNFYLTKLKDPYLQKLYKLFSKNLASLDISNKKITQIKRREVKKTF